MAADAGIASRLFSVAVGPARLHSPLVMQIHFTESRVPELASLTKPERRAVRQRAVALLYSVTRYKCLMTIDFAWK